MICTGTILAMFEITILVLSIVLGLFVAENYGVWSGLLSSLFFMFSGLNVFHRWWWGEWPFNRKRNGKEE